MADTPITARDFEGLPAKKLFELIDGTLYVDGANHGGGPHARLLLHLIAHPPPQPEPRQSLCPLFARYRVTEVEPRAGTIDGLEVVYDGAATEAAVYRYLQRVPHGAAGGPVQVVLPLGEFDMRSPEQWETAVQVIRSRG